MTRAVGSSHEATVMQVEGETEEAVRALAAARAAGAGFDAQRRLRALLEGGGAGTTAAALRLAGLSALAPALGAEAAPRPGSAVLDAGALEKDVVLTPTLSALLADLTRANRAGLDCLVTHQQEHKD